ncbi:type IIL restriction-modification enzyme MmeI [Pseudoxanthobacter sp. M-2]|uniref:class I SAM-dependent DNA methyltransferase n=1 Tax=Pseudoxanthobacter sp. M-2 TaxID=3078754 RepID=UPI0038FD285F
MGDTRPTDIPDTAEDSGAAARAEAFIARWRGLEGGAERANYALFLIQLCDVLGLPHPDPASGASEHNDYVFERAVTFREAGDRVGHGRIDLYRRGAFVLEAKQSRMRDHAAEAAAAGQVDMFGDAAAASPSVAARGRRGAARGWDVLMMNARRQAEDYARALPADHEWPPFILVCDVGHCIEVYADFTGRGRNYAQFPDRQGFRIYLDDLRRPEVRARLRGIWLTPQALDPTKKAAEVTRRIAARLAEVSKSLEARGFPAEAVALFLMRCLFTMFAEDVKLLPEKCFRDLLGRCGDKPENFPRMVGQLWDAMDAGGFAFAIEAQVRRFNGKLFAAAQALPLEREEIGELYAAADADWRGVEPAIFGTLLEQALDPAERRRLGAHYTPRAYVERLVVATVIEPLRKDWEEVVATAERRKHERDAAGALALVQAFHEKLCRTRVLDPACGTGNFLYVAMELVKRLEGEVLEVLADLGGQEALASLEGHTVDPHQFLGLEINPRAAAIAELVLWIGYLQWHFRTKGGDPAEPILRAFGNITAKDAVLTWDGAPLPKVVDGKETYPNPRRPDWPDTEFIVGNPPFIGGKDIRARMGPAYAEALWKAHPHMNQSADFVMYWWDGAADILLRAKSPLKRFGFVTTNSISQVLQRRVMEPYLDAKKPLSIVMAVPDHPWTKVTRDSAAVRIAMSVAQAGKHDGVLMEVAAEEDLDTDSPIILFAEKRGRVNSDLTVGVDVSTSVQLKSNVGLCSNGMKPLGSGFILSRSEAQRFGAGSDCNVDKIVRPYLNGRDVTQRARDVFVIDFYGFTEGDARRRFPELFQHLLSTVKPERERAFERSPTKDNEEYLRLWWLFCKPRQEMRDFLNGLDRYIATVQTAKHRIFSLIENKMMPDQKLMVFGFRSGFDLGVLSSAIHTVWTLRTCGWLGVGNDSVYVKTRTFDPFPFPAATDIQKAAIGALAEELDAHRKRVLAAHEYLTLTGLYNVLERLKSGAKPVDLDARERRIFDDGLVLILRELHEKLDAAVAEAYGWPVDLPEEEILARLVALNKERAAEEAAGKVRWLRPDYQIPRFGRPEEKAAQLEALLEVKAGAVRKPAFPTDDLEQTFAVMDALQAAGAPLSAAEIAAAFRQGKRVEKPVAAVLAALSRLGRIASVERPGGRAFTLRRAA